MWERNRIQLCGVNRFFYLALSNESLENYYRLNFSLMENHNYNLIDLDNMMPWEREIYSSLLLNQIKEEMQENQ